MLRLFSVLTLLAVVLVGCCKSFRRFPNSIVDKNKYESINDTLHLPFDTLRVLELYDIPLSGDLIAELGNEKIEGLNEKWDTLELSLHSFACDCPSWYDESRIPENPSNKMAPPYAYYIEAASTKINLFERWHAIYCNIRFIGKIYQKPGLPKNTEFTDPDPPLGNVFRYYKYEVILPATIWGPYYFTGERDLPSKDELIMSSVLFIPKNWRKK